MFDLEKMKRIDVSKMYHVYDNWPSIAKEALYQENEKIEKKYYDNIIFAGMGGSGTIGDIFTSILSKTEIHSSTVKGYLLPRTITEKSLIVITSVSGNTAETYNILEDSHKNNFKIICFSSGGKIEKYCKKNKIIHYHIDEIHSPRASLIRFLFTMLKIMEPILPIKDKNIFECINELEKLQRIINSSNLSEENVSLTLAEWITDIPLIYYPWGLQAAAIRFKNSLQENAKLHVISEDVIESSHNGIVAWEKASRVKPILIQGKDDFSKTKERWIILKEYFSKYNIEYKEVHSRGDSILSKLVTLIYQLDYCSIYRSIMSEIDPSPVASIKFIKERL